MNIKDMVKDGKKAKLVCYREDKFIYITECGFKFNVPQEDINGQAELHPEERAMTLMKWIRKGLKELKQERESNVS